EEAQNALAQARSVAPDSPVVQSYATRVERAVEQAQAQEQEADGPTALDEPPDQIPGPVARRDRRAAPRHTRAPPGPGFMAAFRADRFEEAERLARARGEDDSAARIVSFSTAYAAARRDGASPQVI